MASSSCSEERPSSCVEANAVTVSVDAKLMVATGRGDCQQLKDMLSKEDSTAIVVVIASSIQPSIAKPLQPIINPLLLSSSCSGSWQDLEFLLNGGNGQSQSSLKPSQEFLDLFMAYSFRNKGTSAQQASDDVEAFLNLPPISAVSLLEGVTVEGGTALHVVATLWRH